MHFERHIVLPWQGRQRPAAKLRIRQTMHLFGSKEKGEHPDASAVGCLLLVFTERNGWREWRRFLDCKPRTALNLLRDMPAGTEF